MPQGKVLGTERSVDFTRSRTNWVPASVGQQLLIEDRLRTLALSRAMVQLAELGRLRVNELTTLEILPPRANNGRAVLDLKAGAMYFFTRDKPREFLIQTPHAIAASEGTEYVVSIEPDGRNLFTVIEGRVELSNPLGTLILTNREQGSVQAGQAPIKTAVIQAVNLVQWWLYYPGVLDVDELALTAAEQAALAASLLSYRSGDLLAALANYPAGRVPQSDAERIYFAALLLAAGQVDKAELQLAQASGPAALTRALRELIAAVTLRDFTDTNSVPQLATEWMARSYNQQRHFDLDGALASAREAARRSTNFGFAWERIAELEFSFGRTPAARRALAKSLVLAPRNAQAWALEGFLTAAQERSADATNAFQKAIALDPALGNAWLGRGLVRLRRGDRVGGQNDLETAAALEPNRSVLRSYLGKAFEQNRLSTNAGLELALAKELDAKDPTPWLYSALLLRQQLRFNEAVTDLEKSVALNDNRAVYRSRLLLDQDRAVRSSSLATIYQSVGLNEVSTREAARAVAADYANPSAHLFLAESFAAQRDPTRFNLRIETAWFNELLLAHLLAPVGAGNLSQNISQQEYSRLFEGNRFGLSSLSEYRSDGQHRELTSQFGTWGRTSYAFDLDYQQNEGVRPNNELDRLEWYTTLKHQLTERDSLFLLLKYQDYHSGDNFQYYDPQSKTRTPNLVAFGITNVTAYRPHFQFDELQRPHAIGGYHHEWSPGVHTLVLGGRLENDQRFSDRQTLQRIFTRDSTSNDVTGSDVAPFDVRYRSEFEIYTIELNQIVQTERHGLVLGSRFQSGTFQTRDTLTLSPGARFLDPFFNSPPTQGRTRDEFERISGYGYYTLKVLEGLFATVGVAYARITFPENYRSVPISSGTTTRDQVSPKAALVWNPIPEVTFRGIFSRALGGVSFDESYRLEPVQLAGFNQSFRNLVPEATVGSVSVPEFQVAGAAVDVKLKSRTYLGLEAQMLESEVRRQSSGFDFDGVKGIPSHTPEHLDYVERSLAATIHQLVSDEWSLGAGYRFTQSELETALPEIPRQFQGVNRHQRADLHQVSLNILYNHPSGFFARSETQFFHQNNLGYEPGLPGDDLVQQNFFLGWRLRRQRAELTLGVLNLNDADYRLNPLNIYAELPRERTFVARLKLNF